MDYHQEKQEVKSDPTIGFFIIIGIILTGIAIGCFFGIGWFFAVCGGFALIVGLASCFLTP